jgi:hypothetical protein
MRCEREIGQVWEGGWKVHIRVNEVRGLMTPLCFIVLRFALIDRIGGGSRGAEMVRQNTVTTTTTDTAGTLLLFTCAGKTWIEWTTQRLG